MSQNAGVEGTTSQGQQGNNPEGTGSQGQETQQTQQQQSQQAAPYAPYLERVPESVRGVIEPVFKDWDAGVQKRFEQLHSQNAWAEPWQEIAQQYDPETVEQAVQVLSALNENPQGFYEVLGNTYGLTAQQAQQVVEQGQQETQNGQEVPDPRYQKLEETVGTLAEMMLSQQQNEQESQEEQAFMQHLEELQKTHGDFDLDYVVTKVAAGVEPEEAVKAYRALITGQAQQLMTPGQQAPVVMGSGGGTPSRSTDLKELDRKSTQELVAQVLAANKQNG